MPFTTSTYPGKDNDYSYIQSRAEMDFEIIDEYAKKMRRGTIFEAAEAINDNGHKFIYDGAHRFEAAKASETSLLVVWKSGTEKEARWLALAANTRHGLRRSPETKRRVTKNALIDQPNLSDRQIARHCDVDHKTVGKIRGELVASGEIPQMDKREVTRDGKTFTQTAKAEPKYATIPELESAVRAWLGGLHSQDKIPDILSEINAFSESGQVHLAEIGKYIKRRLSLSHRKGDLQKACENALKQLSPSQQKSVPAKQDTETKPEPAKPETTSCARCNATDLSPIDWLYGTNHETLCKKCWSEWNSEETQKIAEAKDETPAPAPKELWCSKCNSATWQKNPPDPENVLCWTCMRESAEAIKENQEPTQCNCKADQVCPVCNEYGQTEEPAEEARHEKPLSLGDHAETTIERLDLVARLNNLALSIPDEALPSLEKWIEAMEYKHQLSKEKPV